MVETLRQPVEIKIKARDPNYYIYTTQMNTIRDRGFTNFDGEFHQSLYLYDSEIPSATKDVLSIISPATDIRVDDHWIYGSDSESAKGRDSALARLLTLSDIAITIILQKFREGKISKKAFEDKLYPLEGVRLSAFSELYPEEYKLLAKSRIKDSKKTY